MPDTQTVEPAGPIVTREKSVEALAVTVQVISILYRQTAKGLRSPDISSPDWLAGAGPMLVGGYGRYCDGP